jgi:hypothetical protein
MKSKSKKTPAKPSAKFKDLAAKKNPKGGALSASSNTNTPQITWTWIEGG